MIDNSHTTDVLDVVRHIAEGRPRRVVRFRMRSGSLRYENGYERDRRNSSILRKSTEHLIRYVPPVVSECSGRGVGLDHQGFGHV